MSFKDRVRQAYRQSKSESAVRREKMEAWFDGVDRKLNEWSNATPSSRPGVILRIHSTDWPKRTMEITSSKTVVIVERGVLGGRKETVIPISRIQSVEVSQRPSQRLAGDGDIRIMAGGFGEVFERRMQGAKGFRDAVLAFM